MSMLGPTIILVLIAVVIIIGIVAIIRKNNKKAQNKNSLSNEQLSKTFVNVDEENSNE